MGNYGVTATDDGWDKSSWFDVKPQFKEQNGMINLPYVIDNGFVVTQTNAVLMYLGRKFGLIGSTAQQTSIVEQVLCQAMDLRNDTVGTAYRTGDLAGHLSGNAPTHFAKLEQYLQQLQTTYFGGSTPSVADFHIFEMIEQHQFMAAQAGVEGLFTETPALLRLLRALKEDPRMDSHRTIRWLSMAPPATTGAQSIGDLLHQSQQQQQCQIIWYGRSRHSTRLAMRTVGVHLSQLRMDMDTLEGLPTMDTVLRHTQAI